MRKLSAERLELIDALVAEAESSQLAPSCAPSNPSAPAPIHPSLLALARLLARQIGRSETGNG